MFLALLSVKQVRVGAIDIGSNAIRLVIAESDGKNLAIVHKSRAAVRLGASVFETGGINSSIQEQLLRALKAFGQVLNSFHVSKIRCVGTSALREAKNSKKVLDFVRLKTGVEIQIIDGVEEAQLIHLAIRRAVNLEKHRVLLIDIGGGSVEVSFCEKGLMSATQSFPFGTVRTLSRLRERKLTEAQLPFLISEYTGSLKQFFASHLDALRPEMAIGTGGNIECLSKLKKKLLNKEPTHIVTLDELNSIILSIGKYSIKKRVEKLGLREDRADVIMPALEVLRAVLVQSKVNRLLIPGVGLKDGLIWSMMTK